MAKSMITRTTPYGSAGTLVFDAKNLSEITKGSAPMGTTNGGGVG